MSANLVKATKRIVTAEAKQKAFISSLAIRIAKSMQDPDYEKYKFYKEQMQMLKKKLIKKYAKNVIKLLKEKGIRVKVGVKDFNI